MDKLNPYNTLTKLMKASDVDYEAIKRQRVDNRIPKTMDALKIAEALNTSVEYLVTGEDVAPSYSNRIKHILFRLQNYADEEDMKLVERVLRIKEKEEENAGNS